MELVNKVEVRCKFCKHPWQDTLDERKRVIYRKDEKEKVIEYRFKSYLAYIK